MLGAGSGPAIFRATRTGGGDGGGDADAALRVHIADPDAHSGAIAAQSPWEMTPDGDLRPRAPTSRNVTADVYFSALMTGQ